jgi:hypothetical protein
MIRRKLITLIGSLAIAWPLASNAQQPSQQAGRVYRVAWVATTSPLSELLGPNPVHPQARAFLQGLREHGYVEGKNLQVEWRTAEGKWSSLPNFTTFSNVMLDAARIRRMRSKMISICSSGFSGTVPSRRAPTYPLQNSILALGGTSMPCAALLECAQIRSLSMWTVNIVVFLLAYANPEAD